jgi:hypothetical protein
MKARLLVIIFLAVPTFAKETYAPLPGQLMQAKTVFLENKTKDAKIGDGVFRELSKWKRYVLVTDRSKADIVFVLTMTTHEAIWSNGTRVSNQIAGSGTTITTGGQVYSYTTGRVTLEIQDMEGTVVWANTKPFSRKGATKDLMKDLKQRIERQEKNR